jgi:hypothetical protein
VTVRSGIGPIDIAVLDAIDARSTRRSSGYVTCSDLLPVVQERTGLSPRQSYEFLLDLARPWVIPVPFLAAEGNIGDRSEPAIGPRHVGCRASAAGKAVLDAERRRIAPVPAGLVNGTMYRGGTQPPLEPARVIAALRHLLDDPRASDSGIVDKVGPPFSVTGCIVTGDLEALNAGHQIMLRQTGRVSLTGNPVPGSPPVPASLSAMPSVRSAVGVSAKRDRDLASAQIVVESLPPGVSPDQVAMDLAHHGQAWAGTDEYRADPALPIADIVDIGTSAEPVRIAVTLIPGSDPAAVRAQLASFEGITAEATAAYPAPLATLLRTWVDQHRTEDIKASLARFEDAVQA